MSRIHGLYGTAVHKSWAAMVARCTNETHIGFKNYGGAGVKICSALRLSAEAIADAIGMRPENTSLDRINTKGNYSCGVCEECRMKGWPLNIQWATRKQQSRNTRKNRHITINGETRLLCDWAQVAGVHSSVILKRIRNGWNGADLIKPADPKYHHKASAKPPGE